MINDVAVNYIIEFLLGDGNEYLRSRVSYGTPKSGVQVAIHTSFFFEGGIYLSQKSMPTLPLNEIDGVPILFGNPNIEVIDGVLHIYADIVASTFFLITRYEECVRREVRDMHGRFIGKESLPYRAGFLARPIVEEYGRLLRGWLRECGNPAREPEPQFSKIYLTHDVDQIWTWDNLLRAVRTAVKRTVKCMPDKMESFRAWYNYQKYDPVFTFPWLVEKDTKLKNALGEGVCESVYFLMGCETRAIQDICYISCHDRVTSLVSGLTESGALFGLHPSYAAGVAPKKIAEEKRKVELVLGAPVSWSRNHYLCSREPEDMHALIENGITDDFTLGYADVPGFRLGTCRPVRWIDATTGDLTDLTFHPLTVMDCTLDAPSYMSISSCREAFSYCQPLLDNAYSYAGEVVLLWHNNSVAKGMGYQRELYEEILEYIAAKSDKPRNCGNHS